MSLQPWISSLGCPGGPGHTQLTLTGAWNPLHHLSVPRDLSTPWNPGCLGAPPPTSELLSESGDSLALDPHPKKSPANIKDISFLWDSPRMANTFVSSMPNPFPRPGEPCQAGNAPLLWATCHLCMGTGRGKGGGVY